MPSPAFRAASATLTTTGAANTVLTLTQPASTQIGDVCVAYIYVASGAASPPASSGGWTQQAVSTNTRMVVYTRVATAAGAATSTITFGASTTYTWGMSVYSSIDNTTPVNGTPATSQAYTVPSGSNARLTIPTQTPTVGGGMLVTVGLLIPAGGWGGTSNTPPSGETARLSDTVQPFLTADELLPATPGATGTKVIDFNNTSSSVGSILGVALVLTPNNQAPNAPTLTAPANAAYVDAAAGLTVSWTHSDPNGEAQRSYALRRKIGAGAYEYWNAGTSAWQSSIVWNVTATQSVVFGSGKWTNGNVYQWSVATEDNNAVPLQGPFAADLTFTAQTTPGVAVTAPTGSQGDAQPTVVWSDTLPGGAVQTAYRLVVESGAYGTTPGSGVSAYDSGVVASAVTQSLIGSALVNGVTYRAFVQITETGGQTSSWAYTTFTIALNPPAQPLLAITWDAALSRIPLVLQGRDNLLTSNQASAETDTTGVLANVNCTVARSTAFASDGVACFSMTATAAGTMNMRTETVTSIPATPGAVYTGTVELRAATTARACEVRLVFRDAAGTALQTSTGSFADNTAGWTQGTVTAQAPAGTVWMTLLPTVLSPAAGEVHYADKLGIYPDPTGNLVPNPDFENGTTGWGSNGGGTLAVSTAQSYTGRSSLQHTTVAATSQGVYVGVSLVAGTTYTASIWVYNSNFARTLTLIANGANSATGTATAVQGAWTRVTLTLTASASGNTFFVLYDASGLAATAGQVFYVDAVQVVVGSSAPAYVPPMTSNLCVNPSFELDAVGWNGPAGYGRSTTRAYIGTASGRFPFPTGTNILYTSVDLTPGIYTFSTYAWITADPNPSSGRAYIDVTSGDGTFDSADTLIDKTKIGQWQLLSITFTTTKAGAHNCRFVIESGTVAADVYLDAVQVEAGSVRTSYVDGAQGPGYVLEASETLMSAAASSFEDGTTGGWTAVAGGDASGLVNSTTQAVIGTKSLRATLAANAGSARRLVQTAANLQVAAGGIYTATAWVYSTVAQNLYLVLSDGVSVEVAGGVQAVQANGWTRLVVTGTGYSTSAFAVIEIRANATAAGTLYVDGVQMEQKDHASLYGNIVPNASNATTRRQFPWTRGGLAGAATALVERSRDGGTTWATVRGAAAVPLTAPSQQATVYDYEATPGQLTQYRAKAVAVV